MTVDELLDLCSDEGGCWIPPRRKGFSRSGGYVNSYDPATQKAVLAHRRVYEHMVAAVPPGLQLDHLCRNQECVNPYHLEPVTQQENLRRRTLANRHPGHDYRGSGKLMHCHTCKMEKQRARRAVAA